MPFKSSAQRRACYAKKDPRWNCKEWDMKRRMRRNSDAVELYAQAYSGSEGFYFSSLEDYEKKHKKTRAEEFEIQFIEGSYFAQKAFDALKVTQGSLAEYFDVLEEPEEKQVAILFLLDTGRDLEDALDKADEVQIFEGTPDEYVEELLDDTGLSDEMAETYFDWDKLGRELEITGDDVNGTIEQIEELREDGEDDEADSLQEWVDSIEAKSPQERAMEFVESIGSLQDALGKRVKEYFDYEALARDMEINGEIAEYDGYVITNALEL